MDWIGGLIIVIGLVMLWIASKFRNEEKRRLNWKEVPKAIFFFGFFGILFLVGGILALIYRF